LGDALGKLSSVGKHEVGWEDQNEYEEQIRYKTRIHIFEFKIEDGS